MGTAVVSRAVEERAHIVREPLEGGCDPLSAARWLRDAPRAVAFSGAWAGGAVLSSHPFVVASADNDPFDLLDTMPFELAGERPEDPLTVGGGWFGWFGFGLARDVEPVPPPPPRPRPLPLFDLAFHDHLLRRDASGRWWFEALWTEARAELLSQRREWWRARLLEAPPDPEPFAAGPLQAVGAGPGGHEAAVAEALERIRVGEIYQANICLRLEGKIAGDPLDLWLRAAAALRPAFAAYVSGADHAVLSLSPELFLRRRGREVATRPIKGTARRDTPPEWLSKSAKDRAENVMIVDLMRNDLGRVCEYGTVVVEDLCSVEPAAGVWHLVSTVRGRLRRDVGDAQLLRATFPPGSVTGAPKVQALRVIHQLESTAREAYCGAIGMRSPASGLELNVAIRTFEVRRDRIWIGAGGGIVSDSSPTQEVEEALTKARGITAAARLSIDARPHCPGPSPPPIVRTPRPDPARGIMETICVMRGDALALADHLARLRASGETLGLLVPPHLEESIARAAAGLSNGAIRIVVDGGGARLWTRPLPAARAAHLEPVTLPGGLGAHKWADRAMIDALSSPTTTPLFCDLDGTVLEAGYASVLIVLGRRVLAPPLDGRILPSISRDHALSTARAAHLTPEIGSFNLVEARAADAVILTSSLRGPHPGLLDDGPAAPAAQRICDLMRPPVQS